MSEKWTDWERRERERERGARGPTWRKTDLRLSNLTVNKKMYIKGQFNYKNMYYGQPHRVTVTTSTTWADMIGMEMIMKIRMRKDEDE